VSGWWSIATWANGRHSFVCDSSYVHRNALTIRHTAWRAFGLVFSLILVSIFVMISTRSPGIGKSFVVFNLATLWS